MQIKTIERNIALLESSLSVFNDIVTSQAKMNLGISKQLSDVEKIMQQE